MEKNDFYNLTQKNSLNQVFKLFEYNYKVDITSWPVPQCPIKTLHFAMCLPS
jgi:hypothetical protein